VTSVDIIVENQTNIVEILMGIALPAADDHDHAQSFLKRGRKDEKNKKKPHAPGRDRADAGDADDYLPDVGVREQLDRRGDIRPVQVSTRKPVGDACPADARHFDPQRRR